MGELKLLLGARTNSAPPIPPENVTTLNQFGVIDYTWDAPRKVGTFHTGDPWGLGGEGNEFTFTELLPAYTATASGVNNIGSAYSGRIMNGAQLNPGNRADVGGIVAENTWGTGQGYDQYKDSTNLVYSAALNVDPLKTGSPLVVSEGSVVKAKGSAVPRSDGRPVLSDLAVFTVVRVEPAANQFRPPIAVADKEAYKLYATDVDISFLPNLGVPAGYEASVPDYATVLARTRRMWAQQSTNNLQCRNINAVNNQSEYGQTIGYDIGDAFALLITDTITYSQKKALADQLVQIGWDGYGRWVEGGKPPGIGGNSWMKWCIAFAAKACAASPWGAALATCVSCENYPRDFAEDSMVYTIDQSFVDSPRQTGSSGEGGDRPREPFLPYMRGGAEWTNDYDVNYAAGSNKDLVYRPIVSPVLSTNLFYLRTMGVDALWKSPRIFEYSDIYYDWTRDDPTGQINAFKPLAYGLYWATRGAAAASTTSWVGAEADGEWVWLKNTALLSKAAASTPATSALAVTVNGSPATVSQVLVYQHHLVAKLSAAVVSGDVVTIGYSKPGSNVVKSFDGAQAASVSPISAFNSTNALPPIGIPQLIDNAGTAYLTTQFPLSPMLAYGTAKRFIMAVWFAADALPGSVVNQNLLASQTAATLRWAFVNNTNMTVMVGSNSIARARPPAQATGDHVEISVIDFTKTAYDTGGTLYARDGTVLSVASNTTFDSAAGTREISLADLPDPFVSDGIFVGGLGVLASSVGSNILDGKAGYVWMHWDDGTEAWPTFDAAFAAKFAPALIGDHGEMPLGFRPKVYWPMNKAEIAATGRIANRGTAGDRPLLPVGTFT